MTKDIEFTSNKENKVKNLFLIKFLEMRAKGPSSNFMPVQRFLWALFYMILAIAPAMKLILGTRVQFNLWTTEELILIAAVLGFRLLAFAAISLMNCLYDMEWLTEKVYKSWIFTLSFEGTLYGILLFGKKRFFKDHKIVFGQ